MPGAAVMGGGFYTHTRYQGVYFDLDAFMAAQADGLYFDTTKTDRFFQENTGPTLADDVGEAMGLALDRSQWGGQTLAEVLAGQTELVANGSFATATGWTLGTDWAISGGSLNHVSSAVFEYASFGAHADYVEGSTYCVEFDLTYSSGSLAVWVGGAGSSVVVPPSSGRKRLFVVASTGSIGFRFAAQTFVGSIDNLTVKLVPGKHGIQATGTLKPLRQTTGAKFDGSDDNWLTSYTPATDANFIAMLGTFPGTVASTQIAIGSGSGDGKRVHLGIRTNGQLHIGLANTSTAAGGPDLRNQREVVCLTHDASTVRAFVGSEMVYEAPIAGSLSALIPIRLGALNNDGGGAAAFYSGSIEKAPVGRQFLDLATYRKIRTALLAA